MEKPTIKLTPLEKTVVSTPTLQDFDILMRVYECGDTIRLWDSRLLPTQGKFFQTYKSETCVCETFFSSFKSSSLSYASKEHFLDAGTRIILPEEFYEVQKVTLRQIIEVNRYFDTRK